MSNFSLKSASGAARLGKIATERGSIQTPAFMPVGTYGNVKSLSHQELASTGAEIMLSNTFHLFLQPGMEFFRARGASLHQFTRWEKPILTDSGGFQVFSLAKSRKISQEGATFRSPLDGREVFLSPELSMEMQKQLDSDIAMIFDDCTIYPATHSQAEASMLLSLDWAKRSKLAFAGSKRALFGIVQGSTYPDLRKQSLEALMEIGFDGYALGGLAVGESLSEREHILKEICPLLPENSPRYLMGVGRPQDIVHAVSYGIDMMDCVMPSRNARNGHLFTSKGIIRIRNSKWRHANQPLDEHCPCYTCQNYALDYLHYAFKTKEILATKLLSLHNISYYQNLMKKIREHIQNDSFADFAEGFYQLYPI